MISFIGFEEDPSLRQHVIISYNNEGLSRESQIITPGFTRRFIDMREYGSQQLDNEVNGDIDRLF